MYAGNDAGAVPGQPHTGASELYAWDFITDIMDDKKIYAARSGVVINVIQNHDGGTLFPAGCQMDDPDNPGKMKDSDCDSNKIVVLHQDGTQAIYQHGKHHGAFVSVGDVVQRGQALGISGCVGNCGEPHIHFDVHQSALDEHQRHNLRVQRVEEGLPTGQSSFSIPSTFDRMDGGVCSVPSTMSVPHSTLSPGDTPTDEGGPVYITHLHNEYNLPNKRKIAQTVPPKLVLYTGSPIHTAVRTTPRQVHLTVVPLIPGPLQVSFRHDGTSTAAVHASPHSVPCYFASSHDVWCTLKFEAPKFGVSHHGLTAQVVDRNGNTYVKNVTVTLDRDPVYGE